MLKDFIQLCMNNFPNLSGNTKYTVTCSDGSDKVFPIGAECNNVQTHFDAHCEHFCKDKQNCSIEACLSKSMPCPMDFTNHSTRYNDCGISCAEPGFNCISCTHKDYFNCTKSGVCVHKDLLCDGHPACEHGEDEQVEDCRNKWVEQDVVKKSATRKCSSKMYPSEYILIYGFEINRVANMLS